jgi:hypothetical protein
MYWLVAYFDWHRSIGEAYLELQSFRLEKKATHRVIGGQEVGDHFLNPTSEARCRVYAYVRYVLLGTWRNDEVMLSRIHRREIREDALSRIKRPMLTFTTSAPPVAAATKLSASRDKKLKTLDNKPEVDESDE